MHRSAEEITGYLAVAISTLLPERVLGVRLFIRDSTAAKPRLYRASNIPFERKDRDRLLAAGMHALYISAADAALYQAYLRTHLPDILHDERLSVDERFSALNSVVRDVLARSFRARNIDGSVQGAEELSEHCVEMLTRDDCIAGRVIRLLNHDYQTFTHSANVAYYCVLLARALGISAEADLKAIAAAGFLHDIGKLDIPDHILNKPRKLTDLEYSILKEHPGNGFLKLCGREDLTHPQLMMVYQHHEQGDGGGYPVGCSNEEIHAWSRVCSVADVYEALTSNRPYRPRLAGAEAQQIMHRDSGRKFDAEMLACWMNTIARNS